MHPHLTCRVKLALNCFMRKLYSEHSPVYRQFTGILCIFCAEFVAKLMSIYRKSSNNHRYV
jgi:hypothetical protein